MKEWKMIITENDDRKIQIIRENDGFNVYELLGFTTVLLQDLMEIFRGNTQVDEIKRAAIVHDEPKDAEP